MMVYTVFEADCFALPVFVLCRYIVHSDDHNPYLDSMEEFAKKLVDFEPDLLVVGGLQMMDNFPFQAGKRILATASLPATCVAQLKRYWAKNPPVVIIFLLNPM